MIKSGHESMEGALQQVPKPPEEASNPSDVLFYASFGVGKHTSKKNEKSIGMRKGGASRFAKRTGYTPFVMSTNAARAAERDLLLHLMQARMHGVHTQSPINGMAVWGLFFIESPTFLTKKGLINQRGGDLDNLVTTYLDALVKSEILADDSWITRISCTKRYAETNKITIWLMKDETFEKDKNLE